jgi:hypothetical protein
MNKVIENAKKEMKAIIIEKLIIFDSDILYSQSLRLVRSIGFLLILPSI